MYTREELLEKTKPILFNTDMVQAILDGKKTQTRRLCKPPGSDHIEEDADGSMIGIYNHFAGKVIDAMAYAPYQTGDILYIRETWNIIPCIDCRQDRLPCIFEKIEYEDKYTITDGCFVYRADYPDSEKIVWHPSIHMPKQAARIFLKVTDVWADRLQDIDDEQAKEEGANWKNGKNVGFEEKMRRSSVERFAEIWDSTIKKKDLSKYGWEANPWVWVIEFERLEVSL